MEKVNIKNRDFEIPDGLVKVPLIKYADKNYLPNGFIPNNFICETYVKKGSEFESYPLPVFPNIEPIVFIFDDRINFNFEPLSQYEDKLYKKIYGSLGYHIKIIENGTVTKVFTSEQSYEYFSSNANNLKYEIKIGYEKMTSAYGASFSNIGLFEFTPW